MSYKFVSNPCGRDRLIRDGESPVGGESFEVEEGEGMYAAGPDQVYTLDLSCGDVEKLESWRLVHIEFEDEADYELFRKLLCKAYLITVS
jgi:hypothetical protein